MKIKNYSLTKKCECSVQRAGGGGEQEQTTSGSLALGATVSTLPCSTPNEPRTHMRYAYVVSTPTSL